MTDAQHTSALVTYNMASTSESTQRSEGSLTANAELPQSDPNAESNEPSHPDAENNFEHTDEIGEDFEELSAGSLHETAESACASDISITENCLKPTTPGPNSATNCQKSSEAVASKEEVSWNEVLLSLLECPVCFNYMVPPIVMCESGHNICSYCRPFLCKCPMCKRIFLKTRNISLEKIAGELKLSCRYPECSDVNSDEHLKNHLSTHTYQPPYSCPFTHYTHCYWQGNFVDIKNHMEAEHAEKVLYETHTHDWPLTLTVRDLKIIFSFGEIFLYKLKLDTLNSKFYVQVFYVGPERNHRNFFYTVSLSSNLCNQRISFRNGVLPMNELEQPSSYMFGNCAVFEYSIVSEMSIKGDIKYLLKLIRE